MIQAPGNGLAPEQARYELIFIAQKDETPAAVRLQALLKSAKRRFKFRCVSVKQVEKPQPKRAIKKRAAKGLAVRGAAGGAMAGRSES